MKYEFENEYKFEGQSFTYLKINFEAVCNGGALMELHEKYLSSLPSSDQLLNRNISIALADTRFMLFVLNQLSGQPYEFFKGLPVGVFLDLINVATVELQKK